MTTETSSLLDVFHQIALEPVKGDGVWLYASDGRRYLDFYGGHAVALLGYNRPRLVATLDSEARRLFFQSNAVELEIRERAAEALLRFAPKGFTKVFLVNSGAEANENALRVAFLATKRTRVAEVPVEEQPTLVHQITGLLEGFIDGHGRRRSAYSTARPRI